MDIEPKGGEGVERGVKRLIHVYKRGIIRLSHADRTYVNPTGNAALLEKVIAEAVALDLIERRQGEEGYQLTEKGRSIPPD